MKYFNSQKGALTFGGLIFLILVLVASYVGIKMIMPKITYWQVNEIFRNEVARLKKAPVEDVRKIVLAGVKELGVSFRDDDDYYYEGGLKIYHENEYDETGPYVMEAFYTVDVDFIGGYRYTYHFNPKKVAKQ